MFLVFAAEEIDGEHDEGALDGVAGSVGGIDALELAGDEAGSGVVCAGAIVAFDHGAKEAEFAHFVHDGAVEFFGAVGFHNAREEFVLRVITGGGLDELFVFGEEVVEGEGVFVVKLGAFHSFILPRMDANSREFYNHRG